MATKKVPRKPVVGIYFQSLAMFLIQQLTRLLNNAGNRRPRKAKEEYLLTRL